jgi:DeoR family fructose operon transcriptional repressor
MSISNRANLYAEERQEQIIRYLEEHGKVSVAELCEFFHVSPTTVRNDLKGLNKAGSIKRTHGGAIYKTKTGTEQRFLDKSSKNVAGKTNIAQIALDLIEDGDTIALDTGTTTLAIARMLPNKKGLTIITNDIRIATCLEENCKDHGVILIGGNLRVGYSCTVGPAAQSFLREHYVDKAFIACDGFSLKAGVTTPNSEQAELKKIMIDIAGEKLVVCDSSKLERIAFVKVCDVKMIDVLITDLEPRNELIEKYKSVGLRVFVPEKDEKQL